MTEKTNPALCLLCVLAHPDDESLGTGGILARYAAEEVATYLITATLGERGWLGDPAAYPGPAALGEMRQTELEAAADPTFSTADGRPPHRTSKLYYRALARQIPSFVLHPRSPLKSKNNGHL